MVVRSKDRGSYGWYGPSLIESACGLYSAGCASHSHKVLSQWQQDPNANPVAAELENVIDCAIVANGGQEAFQFMHTKFMNASDHDDPTWSRFLKSLSCATEVEVVHRLMNLSISDPTIITRGGTVDVMAAASKGPKSRPVVLDFALRRSTLEKIIEINTEAYQFVRIIRALCESLTSREELELIAKFVKNNEELQDPAIKGQLNEAYALAETNLAWIKTYYFELRNWFQDNAGNPCNTT